MVPSMFGTSLQDLIKMPTEDSSQVGDQAHLVPGVQVEHWAHLSKEIIVSGTSEES